MKNNENHCLRDNVGRYMLLFTNLLRSKLSEVGLYPGQPIILKIIENNPGISQKDLAEVAEISKPTLNVMLSRFQKNGLVEIKYDENNSKISKVYLTKEGIEKAKIAKGIIKQINEIHFADFSEEEKEMYFKLINKINNNIYKELKEADDESKNN